MRQNLPVTGREHELPPDHMLVSVTDLKGRITYCNPDFEAASGYGAAELLGQPHNLLRHPDMPQEAFRDMWETIQSGLPWTALVKNRCKSGDHYWVRANATPMKAGDRIVGYLSVRTPVAQRDEIAQADALYRRMREQEQRGEPLATVLHRGRVLPGARWRRWLHRVAARGRAFGAAGSAQVGAVALTGMLARATSPAVWLPASLALGLGATAWSRARDQRRLARVTGDALRLAAGDLAHVPSTGLSGAAGEMQLALAQLAVNLRAAIGDVRREVRAAVDSVTEVATGGQDLSRRTESLAASLEQTAAAMDQINGTVQQSAESAVQGARMATQSALVAERSHQAVLGTARAMQAISESSRRIGDITHLIESVAFQTNILALNAAVEAARAGEAGRGFAVVATEVRTLAHRTTEAAREIKQLIAQAGARVDDGVHQTETAQARMMEVLEAVRAVGAMLADLETVAGEQRSGIGQINEAVNHMDGITQQNAAMVEELAAASGALDQQMHAVSDTMRLFRLQAGEHSLAEADAVALRRQSRAAAPSTPARHAERSPERLAA